MLEVNVAVELEAVLDFRDGVRGAVEGVIHVVAGGKVAGFVGELATTELSDLLDFCAFGLEFFGN